jgi:hypothetical protein
MCSKPRKNFTSPDVQHVGEELRATHTSLRGHQNTMAVALEISAARLLPFLYRPKERGTGVQLRGSSDLWFCREREREGPGEGPGEGEEVGDVTLHP